ncbi:alkaline phosphatase family protein [Paenibacillus sp. P36]|uniref:alkaline phosphatase family protein n=1 Tax=Paenibacillus sp. P36 TaxID=3342538 RepID=UPI0038B2ED3E
MGQAYAAVVDSDNGVKLKFENNTVDNSAHATSVTSHGNVTYVQGRDGQAIKLNSTSSDRQYLDLGKPANLQFGTNTSFTLAFWIKSPGVSSDPPVISNKNWDSGSSVGYVLALMPNNSLKWNYNTQGGSRMDAEIPNVANGKWHHIVVSHDRATGRVDFYKDGLPVDIAVKAGALYQGITNSMNIAGRTGTIDAGLNTMIGNDGTGAYGVDTFQMQVDEMQIINRAVTEQEAGELFSSAPIEENSNEPFKGSLNLISAEHAVQGSTFRVNLDLRTPLMSTSIDKSVVELSYDSNLFEFVNATKAVAADTSMPGIVKLEIPGGIIYDQTDPLEYAKSRISEVYFKTKAASGQGQIKVSKAEFYSGTAKLDNEVFQSQPKTVQIHPKATEDLNQDGIVTVGDLALAQSSSEALQNQIAANAKYAPYKRVVVIGMDGGGVSVMPNAPYWETPNSLKDQVGNRLVAPNIRNLIEHGAVSYSVKTTLPSSSSPNWGAMLTGVDYSKHQIGNSESELYYYSESSPYPSIFKKLREVMPDKKLAAFAGWPNILNGHIEPSVGVEIGTGTDEQDTASFVDYVNSGKALDTSLMFIHLDSMDHAGHDYGFYTKKYYEQLTKTDLNVGAIMNSLRDNNMLEDTLVVMLPDHGGGTENPDTTLGSATSHGQDSTLATTTFIAANGRTVATDQGKEKILQGGTTKDLNATVLKALGINAMGDSKVINGMFIDQKDQNRADAPELMLTKVLVPETQQFKHYELAISGQQSPAKAMDVVLTTVGMNVYGVESLQAGVSVVRSESANGRTRVILNSENGITADSALLKIQATPVSENASASLETAVVADSAGREVLPNLLNEVREDVPAGPYTRLNSVKAVDAGEEFVVRLGVARVTDAVYAQDYMLNYDANLLDFVSAKSVKEKVSLIETQDTGGKVRFILASEGPAGAVTGNEQILEVTFRAKTISQSASAAITVESAKLADAAGVETSIGASTISVNIESALLGDVNGDDKVSIGDISMAAAHYGKTTSSPDWQTAKAADVNRDGKIDISDLSAIAMKLLE